MPVSGCGGVRRNSCPLMAYRIRSCGMACSAEAAARPAPRNSRRLSIITLLREEVYTGFHWLAEPRPNQRQPLNQASPILKGNGLKGEGERPFRRTGAPSPRGHIGGGVTYTSNYKVFGLKSEAI